MLNDAFDDDIVRPFAPSISSAVLFSPIRLAQELTLALLRSRCHTARAREYWAQASLNVPLPARHHVRGSSVERFWHLATDVRHEEGDVSPTDAQTSICLALSFPCRSAEPILNVDECTDPVQADRALAFAGGRRICSTRCAVTDDNVTSRRCVPHERLEEMEKVPAQRGSRTRSECGASMGASRHSSLRYHRLDTQSPVCRAS